MVNLVLDSDLCEEAVFLTLRERPASDPAARAWTRERDELYGTPSGRERERGFDELARAWFARLELARPIEAVLEPCPHARARISTLHVRAARRARDEGSNLFAGPRAARPERMVLLCLAQRFQEPRRLEELALCELLHAEDILDPAFGFEPVFDPDPEGGHARRELLRDRFHVLWDARVRGRMARREGGAGGGSVPEHLALRGLRAFGEAPAAGELLRRAWSGELATQRALIDAALGRVAACRPG